VVKKQETFAQELCDILAAHHVVSPAESRAMHRAFKNSSKDDFPDFLLSEGLVEEEPLLEALAEYYQVPAVDVVGYFFDGFELHKFPKEFLLENNCIPLEVEGNVMIIVASDPANPDLPEAINKFVEYDIQFRVGLARDIQDSVKEFYESSLTDIDDDTDDDKEHSAEKEAFREMLQEEEEKPDYDE
jgi:hypothetical protein